MAIEASDSIRLINVWEADRLSIARELHDGPVQELYALRFEISTLIHELSDDSVVARLSAMHVSLQQVAASLRTLCTDLRPPADFDLASALRAYVARFAQRYPDISVTASIADTLVPALTQTNLALFRICQEALNNAVRHAQAASISVRLSDQLHVEIRDDGRGFVVAGDWRTLMQQGHMGMFGMVERALSIGAELAIHSAPGEGTAISISLPAK